MNNHQNQPDIQKDVETFEKASTSTNSKNKFIECLQDFFSQSNLNVN